MEAAKTKKHVKDRHVSNFPVYWPWERLSACDTQ